MTHQIGTSRATIIYEDDALIAVNKPSGMLVIETPKAEPNTLTRLLNDDLDMRGVEANAYPCHRIDRETSGVILYAKGKANQQKVMDAFRERVVKKVYIAFVHGRVKRPQGTLTSKLFNPVKRREELAVTQYRALRAGRDFTLVEVRPVTGRTNQIRRQFTAIGNPLVGERVYKFAKDYELKFKRLALHALSLTFPHPVTGAKTTFNSDLPADMREFLNGHGMRWESLA